MVAHVSFLEGYSVWILNKILVNYTIDYSEFAQNW